MPPTHAPELSGSMKRRGVQILGELVANTPAQSRKLPMPGVETADVIDLVGLGIVHAWQDRVQKDPLGQGNEARVCLTNLSQELLAWHGCQATGCSEVVFREACACLCVGDDDEKKAMANRDRVMRIYRKRSATWNEYLNANKAIAQHYAEHYPEKIAEADESEPEEPVSKTFPNPAAFAGTSKSTSETYSWRVCFQMLSCILRALDETLQDGIDAPVLRMWRDAQSADDIINVYSELKHGISADRIKNPASWAPGLLLTSIELPTRSDTINKMVDNMDDMFVMAATKHFTDTAHVARKLKSYGDKPGCRLVLSYNGYVAEYDEDENGVPKRTYMRWLMATALHINYPFFQHLLAQPDVDVNARTWNDNRAPFSGLTTLLALPLILGNDFNSVPLQMMKDLLMHKDINPAVMDPHGHTVLHSLVDNIPDEKVATHNTHHATRLLQKWDNFLEAMRCCKAAGTPVQTRTTKTQHTAGELFERKRTSLMRCIRPSAQMRPWYMELVQTLDDMGEVLRC